MTEENNNVVIEKPQRFLNPYNPLPKEKKCQVVVDISKEDNNLVKCTRPGYGTISTVTGYLWLNFCISLRKYGITDVSKESELEDFTINSVIIPASEYQQLLSDSAKLQRSLIRKPLKKKDEVQGE
jgi:hypothetical protein